MQIVSDFVVTGSQVYGPVRKDSDLDMVLTVEDAELFTEWLQAYNIEPYQTESQKIYEKQTGISAGFYFSLCGIEVNIIIVADKKTLDRWRKDVERLRAVPPIEDKQKRVDYFNGRCPICGVSEEG